jgi:hypothetical protein
MGDTEIDGGRLGATEMLGAVIVAGGRYGATPTERGGVNDGDLDWMLTDGEGPTRAGGAGGAEIDGARLGATEMLGVVIVAGGRYGATSTERGGVNDGDLDWMLIEGERAGGAGGAGELNATDELIGGGPLGGGVIVRCWSGNVDTVGVVLQAGRGAAG